MRLVLFLKGVYRFFFHKHFVKRFISNWETGVLFVFGSSGTTLIMKNQRNLAIIYYTFFSKILCYQDNTPINIDIKLKFS